jgi:AcrR family transcriptional regulator
MTLTADNPPAASAREQILLAARNRFRYYGYSKTTMAEIADDAGMSAANLYRYFPGKLDIGTACARSCISDALDALGGVVRQPGISAEDRLEAFVLAMLAGTQALIADNPRINELVETIASERQDIVHWKNDRLKSYIAEILAMGNESGEFTVEDIATTATAVYNAVALFSFPLVAGLYPREVFEQMARDVVHLLVKGLRKR